MADYFRLQRFIEAQDNANSYETALQEVIDGSKNTHWIWYVFPQMRGLGHSSMAEEYGISSLLEAKAYFEDTVLHRRLIEITEALYRHNGHLSPTDIFGGLDAMKVRSCMTLFDIISPHSIFNDVLRDCYDGERCGSTIRMTRQELEKYSDHYPMNVFHINGKSLLEIGSYEAGKTGEDVAIATLFDIRSRGYSIIDMVRGYLYETDLTDYRTGGIESTLAIYLKQIALEAYGATDNSEVRRVIKGMVGGRDPYEMSLFDLASLLDTMIYEVLHIPSLELYVSEKKEQTMIKNDTTC